MKRILVTGGAGFIGSHTVDLLLQQDNLQVTVLDNLVSGKVSNLDLSHPRLKFIEADVLNYPMVLKEVSASDSVLHLAALPSVPKSIEDPVGTLQVNTLGFVNILQAIRESHKPIRLVYASSAAVYGCVAQLPCSDDAPLPFVTLSPYALEKANNERYADLYARLFGIKSLGLRYFNVYGARQDPNSPYSGVISKFIECYQAQTVIPVFGDGEQSRDFIEVTDVACANQLALQGDYCGVLNIATGVPETLINLIRYIEAVGGKAAQVDYKAARAGDIPKSYATISKAEQYLRFRYTQPLAEGIRSLLG